MATSCKRQINKMCPSCGERLFVLVNDDDQVVIRDGDAQAVCESDHCNRSGEIIDIDPAEAKNHWQVEP